MNHPIVTEFISFISWLSSRGQQELYFCHWLVANTFVRLKKSIKPYEIWAHTFPNKVSLPSVRGLATWFSPEMAWQGGLQNSTAPPLFHVGFPICICSFYSSAMKKHLLKGCQSRGCSDVVQQAMERVLSWCIQSASHCCSSGVIVSNPNWIAESGGNF